MFSVRLVSADSYQAQPLPQLDPAFSEFRGSEIKHVPIIRVFGTLPTGEKTCLHIHGVFPYMYVPYTGEEDPASLAYRLAASLDAAINVSLGSATSSTQHVYLIQRVSGIPFYGYHKKEHQFLKIYFYNPAMIKRAADLLQNGSVLNRSLQPHEAHIPYVLQFMMDYNVYGMSMINLKGVKHRRIAQSLAELGSSVHSEISESSEIDYLPSSVERQSTCELEIDALASDILNRREIERGLDLNPGLAAIWEEERARRAQAGLQGGDSQLVNPKSPPRPTFQPTDNDVYQDQRLARRLMMISQCDESTLSTTSNRSVAYAAEVREGENLLNSSNISVPAIQRSQLGSRDDSVEYTSLLDSSTIVESQKLSGDCSVLGTDDLPLVDMLVELAGGNTENSESVDTDSVLGSQASLLNEPKSDNEDDDIPDLNLTSLQLDSLSDVANVRNPVEHRDDREDSLRDENSVSTVHLSPFLTSCEAASGSSRSGDDENPRRETRASTSERMPQYDGAGDVSPTLVNSSSSSDEDNDEDNEKKAKEFSHSKSENHDQTIKSTSRTSDLSSNDRCNEPSSAHETDNKSPERSRAPDDRCNVDGTTDTETSTVPSPSALTSDAYLGQYTAINYEPFDRLLEIGPDFVPDLEGLHSSMEIGILLCSGDSDSPESIVQETDKDTIALDAVLNGDPCFTESAELDKSDVTELRDQYASLLGNSLLPDVHTNPRIDDDLGSASNFSDSDYQGNDKNCAFSLSAPSPRSALASRDSSSSSENVTPNIQDPEARITGSLRKSSVVVDSQDDCKELPRAPSDNSDYNCNFVATWAELQNIREDKRLYRLRNRKTGQWIPGPRQSRRKADRRSLPNITTQLFGRLPESMQLKTASVAENCHRSLRKVPLRSASKSPVKKTKALTPVVQFVSVERTIETAKRLVEDLVVETVEDKLSTSPLPNVQLGPEVEREESAEESSCQRLHTEASLAAFHRSIIGSENPLGDTKKSPERVYTPETFPVAESIVEPAFSVFEELAVGASEVVEQPDPVMEISRGTSHYSSQRSERNYSSGCREHRHCRWSVRTKSIVQDQVFTSDQIYIIEKRKRGKPLPPDISPCRRGSCKLPFVRLSKFDEKIEPRTIVENSSSQSRVDVEKIVRAEEPRSLKISAVDPEEKLAGRTNVRDCLTKRKPRGRRKRAGKTTKDSSLNDSSSVTSTMSSSDEEPKSFESSDWAENEGRSCVRRITGGEEARDPYNIRTTKTSFSSRTRYSSQTRESNRRATATTRVRHDLPGIPGIPGIIDYPKKRGRRRKTALSLRDKNEVENPKKPLCSLLFPNWGAEREICESPPNGASTTIPNGLVVADRGSSLTSDRRKGRSLKNGRLPTSPLPKRNHGARSNVDEPSASPVNRSTSKSNDKKINSSTVARQVPENEALNAMLREVKDPGTRAKIKFLIKSRKSRCKPNNSRVDAGSVDEKSSASTDDTASETKAATPVSPKNWALSSVSRIPAVPRVTVSTPMSTCADAILSQIGDEELVIHQRRDDEEICEYEIISLENIVGVADPVDGKNCRPASANLVVARHEEFAVDVESGNENCESVVEPGEASSEEASTNEFGVDEAARGCADDVALTGDFEASSCPALSVVFDTSMDESSEDMFDTSTETIDEDVSAKIVNPEELSNDNRQLSYRVDKYAINETNFFTARNYTIDAVSLEIPTCLFEEDSNSVEQRPSRKFNHDCLQNHDDLSSVADDTASSVGVDPRDLDVYDAESLTNSSSFSQLADADVESSLDTSAFGEPNVNDDSAKSEFSTMDNRYSRSGKTRDAEAVGSTVCKDTSALGEPNVNDVSAKSEFSTMDDPLGRYSRSGKTREAEVEAAGPTACKDTDDSQSEEDSPEFEALSPSPKICEILGNSLQEQFDAETSSIAGNSESPENFQDDTMEAAELPLDDIRTGRRVDGEEDDSRLDEEIEELVSHVGLQIDDELELADTSERKLECLSGVETRYRLRNCSKKRENSVQDGKSEEEACTKISDEEESVSGEGGEEEASSTNEDDQEASTRTENEAIVYTDVSRKEKISNDEKEREESMMAEKDREALTDSRIQALSMDLFETNETSSKVKEGKELIMTENDQQTPDDSKVEEIVPSEELSEAKEISSKEKEGEELIMAESDQQTAAATQIEETVLTMEFSEIREILSKEKKGKELIMTENDQLTPADRQIEETALSMEKEILSEAKNGKELITTENDKNNFSVLLNGIDVAVIDNENKPEEHPTVAENDDESQSIEKSNGERPLVHDEAELIHATMESEDKLPIDGEEFSPSKLIASREIVHYIIAGKEAAVYAAAESETKLPVEAEEYAQQLQIAARKIVEPVMFEDDSKSSPIRTREAAAPTMTENYEKTLPKTVKESELATVGEEDEQPKTMPVVYLWTSEENETWSNEEEREESRTVEDVEKIFAENANEIEGEEEDLIVSIVKRKTKLPIIDKKIQPANAAMESENEEQKSPRQLSSRTKIATPVTFENDAKSHSTTIREAIQPTAARKDEGFISRVSIAKRKTKLRLIDKKIRPVNSAMESENQLPIEIEEDSSLQSITSTESGDCIIAEKDGAVDEAVGAEDEVQQRSIARTKIANPVTFENDAKSHSTIREAIQPTIASNDEGFIPRVSIAKRKTKLRLIEKKIQPVNSAMESENQLPIDTEEDSSLQSITSKQSVDCVIAEKDGVVDKAVEAEDEVQQRSIARTKIANPVFVNDAKSRSNTIREAIEPMIAKNDDEGLTATNPIKDRPWRETIEPIFAKNDDEELIATNSIEERPLREIEPKIAKKDEGFISSVSIKEQSIVAGDSQEEFEDVVLEFHTRESQSTNSRPALLVEESPRNTSESNYTRGDESLAVVLDNQLTKILQIDGNMNDAGVTDAESEQRESKLSNASDEQSKLEIRKEPIRCRPMTIKLVSLDLSRISGLNLNYQPKNQLSEAEKSASSACDFSSSIKERTTEVRREEADSVRAKILDDFEDIPDHVAESVKESGRKIGRSAKARREPERRLPSRKCVEKVRLESKLSEQKTHRESSRNVSPKDTRLEIGEEISQLLVASILDASEENRLEENTFRGGELYNEDDRTKAAKNTVDETEKIELSLPSSSAREEIVQSEEERGGAEEVEKIFEKTSLFSVDDERTSTEDQRSVKNFGIDFEKTHSVSKSLQNDFGPETTDKTRSELPSAKIVAEKSPVRARRGKLRENVNGSFVDRKLRGHTRSTIKSAQKKIAREISETDGEFVAVNEENSTTNKFNRDDFPTLLRALSGSVRDENATGEPKRILSENEVKEEIVGLVTLKPKRIDLFSEYSEEQAEIFCPKVKTSREKFVEDIEKRISRELVFLSEESSDENSELTSTTSRDEKDSQEVAIKSSAEESVEDTTMNNTPEAVCPRKNSTEENGEAEETELSSRRIVEENVEPKTVRRVRSGKITSEENSDITTESDLRESELSSLQSERDVEPDIRVVFRRNGRFAKNSDPKENRRNSKAGRRGPKEGFQSPNEELIRSVEENTAQENESSRTLEEKIEPKISAKVWKKRRPDNAPIRPSKRFSAQEETKFIAEISQRLELSSKESAEEIVDQKISVEPKKRGRGRKSSLKNARDSSLECPSSQEECEVIELKSPVKIKKIGRPRRKPMADVENPSIKLSSSREENNVEDNSEAKNSTKRGRGREKSSVNVQKSSLKTSSSRNSLDIEDNTLKKSESSSQENVIEELGLKTSDKPRGRGRKNTPVESAQASEDSSFSQREQRLDIEENAFEKSEISSRENVDENFEPKTSEKPRRRDRKNKTVAISQSSLETSSSGSEQCLEMEENNFKKLDLSSRQNVDEKFKPKTSGKPRGRGRKNKQVAISQSSLETSSSGSEQSLEIEETNLQKSDLSSQENIVEELEPKTSDKPRARARKNKPAVRAQPSPEGPSSQEESDEIYQKSEVSSGIVIDEKIEPKTPVKHKTKSRLCKRPAANTKTQSLETSSSQEAVEGDATESVSKEPEGLSRKNIDEVNTPKFSVCLKNKGRHRKISADTETSSAEIAPIRVESDRDASVNVSQEPEMSSLKITYLATESNSPVKPKKKGRRRKNSATSTKTSPKILSLQEEDHQDATEDSSEDPDLSPLKSSSSIIIINDEIETKSSMKFEKKNRARKSHESSPKAPSSPEVILCETNNTNTLPKNSRDKTRTKTSISSKRRDELLRIVDLDTESSSSESAAEQSAEPEVTKSPLELSPPSSRNLSVKSLTENTHPDFEESSLKNTVMIVERRTLPRPKKRVRFDETSIRRRTAILRSTESLSDEIIVEEPSSKKFHRLSQTSKTIEPNNFFGDDEKSIHVSDIASQDFSNDRIKDRTKYPSHCSLVPGTNGLRENKKLNNNFSDNVSLDLSSFQKASTKLTTKSSRAPSSQETIYQYENILLTTVKSSESTETNVPVPTKNSTDRDSRRSKHISTNPSGNCVQLRKPRIVLKRLSRDSLKIHGYTFRSKSKKFVKNLKRSVDDIRWPVCDGPADLTSSESDDDPDVTIAREERRVCVYQSAKKSVSSKPDSIVTPKKRKLDEADSRLAGPSSKRRARAAASDSTPTKSSCRSPSRTSMLKSPGRLSGYYSPLKIIVTSPKVRRETPDRETVNVENREARSSSRSCVTPRRDRDRLHERMMRGRISVTKSSLNELGEEHELAATTASERSGELDGIASSGHEELDSVDETRTRDSTPKDSRDVRKRLVFLGTGENSVVGKPSDSSDETKEETKKSKGSGEHMDLTTINETEEYRESVVQSDNLDDRESGMFVAEPKTSRSDFGAKMDNRDRYDVTTEEIQSDNLADRESRMFVAEPKTSQSDFGAKTDNRDRYDVTTEEIQSDNLANRESRMFVAEPKTSQSDFGAKTNNLDRYDVTTEEIQSDNLADRESRMFVAEPKTSQSNFGAKTVDRDNLAERESGTFVAEPKTSQSDSGAKMEDRDPYDVTTDEDSVTDDALDVTFSQYVDSQLNKNRALLDRSKLGGESSDEPVVLRPKFDPPSRQHCVETMETHGIPRHRNQEPFFSIDADVPRQKELAHKILKVPGKSLKDVPAFVSSVEGVAGISRWRKMKIMEFVPSLTRSNDVDVKIALCSNDKVVLTPLARPPTRKEANDWLRAREYLAKKKKQVEDESRRKKIEVKKKNEIEAADEVGECSSSAADRSVVERSLESAGEKNERERTLNRILKMKLANKGLSKRVEEDEMEMEPQKADETRRGSGDSNSSEIDPSLLSVLGKSRLFREQEASRHLGVSCGQIDFLSDSTRSNVANENLQNAKALTRYQYLTIMCLEVHVTTRGDLLPDAQYDSIAAIFYSVQSDVPPTSTIEPLEHGVIVVAETDRAKNKMYYSYASKFPWSISFAQNEEALLNSLVNLITRVDPEILIGWELETLSWGYVFQRASSLGMNLYKRISRIPATQGKWEAQPRDIETLAEVKLPGRIVLDIWRIMRHEAALLSYTFESIMHHVLNERISCPSFKTLTDWWNMERPRPSRWRVIEHYSIRVLGVFRILDQLDIIGRTSELARLFGIQFFEVFSRGSQYRVESVMLRLAKPLNYIAVSPSAQQRASMRAMEALPLIMEPESMFYSDPLIVLDFQSLYPSIIIAHNYCFSTCLGRIEHIGQPEPFEFGAYTLRVPKSTALKLQGKVNFAPCGVAFVKSEVCLGVLPRMLTEILETRFMVKKAMKDHKQDDKTLQRALHSRQMGLKFLANVTYGYTAANFSGRMPCIEVGDSVVSKAKETLERAIKLVERTPKWGARVVYGDTDSLFILVPGKSKADAFVIGNEIADAVTAANPPPIKLKFEKVVYPAILQTKKRYCGYMYETPDQEKPTYLAKGIETVRRDGCPAVSKILEKTLKILFETKDVSLVKKYVTRQLDKVLRGKVSIQDLTFAKEFRGLKGYRAKACVPALELTKRLMKKDPRAVPRNSERVRYVIVAGAPNQALIHCVRTPWELINDPGLRPNAVYYVTRVIIPPLNRCLNLMGVDVNAWYREMPHRHILDNPVGQPGDKQKLTIFQYFGTIVCAVCGQSSNKGICPECVAKPSDALVVLHEKLRRLDRTNSHVTTICQSCVGQPDMADCASLDCPVLYRRAQARRELTQATHLRSIIESGNKLEL